MIACIDNIRYRTLPVSRLDGPPRNQGGHEPRRLSRLSR